MNIKGNSHLIDIWTDVSVNSRCIESDLDRQCQIRCALKLVKLIPENSYLAANTYAWIGTYYYQLNDLNRSIISYKMASKCFKQWKKDNLDDYYTYDITLTDKTYDYLVEKYKKELSAQLKTQ